MTKQTKKTIAKPQQPAALGRTYLREWRKFRGLSQEDVAARTGTTQSIVSKIESGKQGYDQSFLERAAPVYGCSPSDLLSVDPNSLGKNRDESSISNAPPDWTFQVFDWTLQAVGHDKHEAGVIVGFVRELVQAPLDGIAAQNPQFALRLRFEDAMRAFPFRYSQEKAE